MSGRPVGGSTFFTQSGVTVSDKLRVAAEIANEVNEEETIEEEKPDEIFSRKNGTAKPKYRGDDPNVIKFQKRMIKDIFNDEEVARVIATKSNDTPPEGEVDVDGASVSGLTIASSTLSQRHRSMTSLNTLEADDDDDDSSTSSDYAFLNLDQPGQPLYQRMFAFVSNWIQSLHNDFSVRRNSHGTNGFFKSKPISLTRLTSDAIRTAHAGRPYLEFFNGVLDILLWKRPFYTFLVLIAYLHAVFSGWILPYLTLLIVIQLSFNFLTYKGYPSVCIFPRSVVDPNVVPIEITSFTKGSSLVLLLIQLTQTVLERLTDVLDKLKYVAEWKYPSVTGKIYVAAIACFVGSLFLSSSTIFTILGVLIGLYIFIGIPIFNTFPRIQRRFDPLTWVHYNVPSKRKRYIEQRMETQHEADDSSEEKRETTSNKVSELGLMAANNVITGSLIEPRFDRDFAFPLAKRAVKYFKKNYNAKHVKKNVYVYDRDLSFPKSLASGILCFTDNHLTFKYNKKSKKNGTRRVLSLPFGSIAYIGKTRNLPIPGISGLSIEIAVEDKTTPFIFAGLSKSDYCRETLIQLGQANDCEWAFNITT